MARTGAAISVLDHETETMFSLSENTEEGWASAGLTEDSCQTNMDLYMRKKDTLALNLVFVIAAKQVP